MDAHYTLLYMSHEMRLSYKKFSCVIFLILGREKAKKVFGFAFLRPLRADGTTILDGGHQLVIYKVLITIQLLPDVILRPFLRASKGCLEYAL